MTFSSRQQVSLVALSLSSSGPGARRIPSPPEPLPLPYHSVFSLPPLMVVRQHHCSASSGGFFPTVEDRKKFDRVSAGDGSRALTGVHDEVCTV